MNLHYVTTLLVLGVIFSQGVIIPNPPVKFTQVSTYNILQRGVNPLRISYGVKIIPGILYTSLRYDYQGKRFPRDTGMIRLQLFSKYFMVCL